MNRVEKEVDAPVLAPLALPDQQRPLFPIDVGGFERRRLRDPQPAAQHEQEDEAVPDRVDDLDEAHQVPLRHGLGQGQGSEDSVTVAPDRLLAQPAFLHEEVKELLEQASGWC